MNNKYSQYNEEHFLFSYFKNIKEGFVVDIGAADGTSNSNSRALIESGWSALLLEPNINNYNKIVELHSGNNKVTIENCGCGEKTEEKTLNIDHNDEYQQLSTYSDDQVEKCKKMYSCNFTQQKSKIYKTQDIFDKYNIKNINFLSVDTESYDESVLSGIDFNKTDIELICIEDIRAKKILENKDYKICHISVGNMFFNKKK